MLNIQIQSLHFEASESLIAYTEKKVNKLEKFSNEITSADVILKLAKPEEGCNKEASIKLLVKNDELYANKLAESFEEAITLCCDALEKQLSKYKHKEKPF